MKTKKIYIMDCTLEESQELYDECLDLIEADQIAWECFSGNFTDLRSIRIELKEVEGFAVSYNDTGCMLEITTANYIMMHDITTASEVRCMV